MASYDKEQLFTYDGRFATFKKTTKKRGSTASGRGKALNWPHKQITPADLAKAGFWYNPSPDSPDNVECFLCEKSLDGWEAGDDALTEHITHASHCGWAVLSAIESEFDDYATRNPTGEQLVEARLATFADRWPHEGKKGWMCKVDRLVEAGWMYTPTSDSDDMATCVYCQLALDGWEPSDVPYDEHYKRSPNCAFFLLGGVSQPTKKTARSKSSRSSKASQAARLSTQSNTATAADITVADTTANPEDSVISTASTMTTTSKKGRPKKGAAKGGKKKAAKKEQPPPVEEPVEPEPEPEQVEEEIVEAPPPAKSTRGKKRGSAAVEDSIVSTMEAPAPKKKKRATKTRESKVAETSIATEDTEMTEAPSTRKASGTKKARASSQTRKASVSSRAASFLRSATPEEFPDDDEIERQLEADLERQLTEDELAYTPAPVKDTKPTKNKTSSDYDMFNPEPVEADEDEVDDELQMLQAQMEMEEPQLKVAKKGRKAGTRKASKQTQPKRPKAPSPPPVTEESEVESQVDASEDEGHNASLGSTSTVVKKAGSVRESNASRGRSRARQPSVTSDEEDSIEIVDYAEAKVETEEEEEEEEEETERRQSTPKAAQIAAQLISSSPAPVETEEEQAEEEEEEPEEEEEEETAVPTSDFEVAEDDAESSPIRSALNSLAEPPSTPGSFISPSASAKQAALSPSQSPQSSDAENQPPSSVPTVKAKRTVLAPLAVTPSKMSPSKRNVIAGLQSSKPWSAANLDAIFGTPKAGANKENGVEKLLKQGKELTSPEKQMTVEQWIKFNADEAEKKLKHECERMVSRFESEGSRAMQVLEGLETE